MKSSVDYFTELTDPRVDRTKDRLMEDIVFITVAAVICGAATWNDIGQYGKSGQSRLSRYLRLPNGIPSHDTFNRIFSALDPDGFEGAFLSWIKGRIVPDGGRDRKHGRQDDTRFAYFG